MVSTAPAGERHVPSAVSTRRYRSPAKPEITHERSGPLPDNALPAGALLVNVGRGPVVDEGALYRALASGHLAAAGLDVWYRYPEDAAARRRTLPSAYPFHQLDNVATLVAGALGLAQRLELVQRW